jgi:hypothetical protein
MLRRLPALLAVAFTACLGGSLATRMSDTSPSPAPEVMDCARGQLNSLGVSQSSDDAERLRLTASKLDESQRRPDTQFRRMVDRVAIEVAPAGAGAVTAITVDATTFAEMTTQRGPTEVQEKASETARGAAQTILQKCSQPVDSLSVPG